MTSALGSTVLQIATTQAQFNYCVLIWSEPDEPRTFCWLWAAAMFSWLCMALSCTVTDIWADRVTGDFAFAPLSAAQGFSGRCQLFVHRAKLAGCLLVLNLMNVPRNLKYVVVRLHMGGNIHSRMYGDDSLRGQYNFENEAQHRYVVINYEDKVLHDFPDMETALVHWPLHCISAVMLFLNFQQFRTSAYGTLRFCVAGGSLVLTSGSLVLKCKTALQYLCLRSAYIAHFRQKLRTGSEAEQKVAQTQLHRFWLEKCFDMHIKSDKVADSEVEAMS